MTTALLLTFAGANGANESSLSLLVVDKLS